MAEIPDDNEAYRQLVSNVPRLYKPTTNPGVKALLIAIAQGDAEVRAQILEVKDQLYVQTADGKYLSARGQSYGVERPSGIGMSDDDYRELIPVMSFVPKQIRQPIQELLRIWYGERHTFAHVASTNSSGTFSLTAGNTTTIDTDTGTYKIVTTTENLGGASASLTTNQVLLLINQQFPNGEIVAFKIPEINSFAIRTATLGSSGWVQKVTDGIALSLASNKKTLSSLECPAVVYEVKNREVVVIMPSTPAVVKRGELGAFYLNANASGTTDSGYVFDPNAKFSVSGIKTVTNEAVAINTNRQALLATMPTTWPDTGYFVFDYGLSTEEGPIRFIGKPNAGGLLLDPSYVFKKAHASGATINYIRSLGAPAIPASSPAAYITGIAQARQALKDLIRRVVASGIAIRFVVLTPEYEFENKALDTNEAL